MPVHAVSGGYRWGTSGKTGRSGPSARLPEHYIPSVQKTCTKCGQTKAIEAFHVNSRARDGRSSACGTCKTEAQKAYARTAGGQAKRIRYRNDPLVKQRERDQERRRWREEPDVQHKMQLLAHARRRAKAEGVAYDLRVEDIVIPATCPCLGIPLVRGTISHGPGSPTLDRKRPELGYTRGNVWIVSYRANRIKNDASPEELLRIATAVAEACRAGS